MNTNNPSEEFARLWTKTQPVVSRLIESLIPNHHQAEDVLQTVAVKLVQKFDQYDRSRPFTPWAIGVAKLEILACRRKWSRDRHVLFNPKLVGMLAEEVQSMEVELAEQRRVLAQCVGKLNSRARQVLQLRYTEDRSSFEIAEHLKMAPGSIRGLLHRIRQLLRNCIEQGGKKMGVSS